MSIIIFSRTIRTGKTTELMEWCAGQENIEGILMPDVDGARKVLDIKTQEIFEIECPDPSKTNEPLTTVGRFHFYTSAIQKANEILLKALNGQPGWLIIDEIGKLELAGKGFYEAFVPIVKYYAKPETTGKLLITVRESLLVDVIDFFGLKNYRVVSSLSELG